MAVNSLVTLNAEAYYRAMVKGGPEDWNIRDHHMVETVSEILNYYGNDTKIIIWEHNTHIGDARATDMVEDGMVNVGQIMREKYGERNVYTVGFGTYKGSVTASRSWGDSIEILTVPQAMHGSWEHSLHEADPMNKIIIFTDENKHLFKERIGHRAIGVVYNPEHEQYGNYVPSVLSERYDSFIYIEETKALKSLVTDIVTM